MASTLECLDASPLQAGAMFIYQALGSNWVGMPLDRASGGQDLNE